MADNANDAPDKVDDNLHPDDNLDNEDLDKESLTDEEKENLRALLQDDEARILAEAGFPQYKSFKDLIEGYRNLNDEDKVVFPIIKELAAQYKMTPHEFAKAIRDKATGGGGSKPTGDKSPAKDLTKEVEKLTEQNQFQTKLQNRFLRFQMKMEKEEVDIPDSMFDDLTALMPGLFIGKSKEQIEKMDWFGDAYDLHLFRLSKTTSPDELRKKLSVHDAKRLAKLKQLGVPRGGPGKGKTQSEDTKTWGSGIDALPEPKK